jgi:hypothetical protein
VAIVQISRITQRKGLEEDLPQPLAGAELGWAIDQRRLFIGNGSLAEGAPVVGNTEILTEFSDLLAFTTAYIYKGDAAGYTVQTGVTPGSPVSQSLQSRLDRYAIVTEFGATGDGVTDDTAAINRALFQLYCIQSNTQVRRSLFFPAGTYKISDTLLIPPFAKFYGEGANSSVIQFRVIPWTNNTAYQAGVLVENLATSLYYRSKAQVPAEDILLSNTVYWEPAVLPEFVARTADSLQQTGVNIGQNGAVTPTSVEISSMSFQTTTHGNDSSLSHNVMLLEQISQMFMDSVTIAGPLQQADLDNALDDLSGIRFASTAALPCTQITLDKCQFHGLTFGISTDQLTKGITVSNGDFDTLYQGIVLGDAAPVDGGPQGFRVTQNVFDNIYNQGIVFDQCSFNASAHNIFYDVGNHFLGTSQPASSIISINADNNVSVGDSFLRNDSQSVQYPRISLFNSTTQSVPVSIAVTGGEKLQMGSWTRTSGQQATLVNGSTNQTFLTVDSAAAVSAGGFSSFQMSYTIKRQAGGSMATRIGVLTVVAGGDDSAGDGLVYSDDYTENEQTDVTLSVTEISDQINVQYTAENTGINGIIYYSLSYSA